MLAIIIIIAKLNSNTIKIKLRCQVVTLRDAHSGIHTFDEEAGSGFNNDGREGAGVGVWRLVDEMVSSAVRLCREGGEPKLSALFEGLVGRPSVFG